MTKILSNKRLSYLLTTLTVLLVVLVLILVATLTQQSSLNAEVARIEQLRSDVESDIIDKEQYEQYLESNDFVIDWAIANGLLDKDDFIWTED